MDKIASIPKKHRKLIIFGTEDFADIAYEYFTYDSDYEVVGFTADRAYVKEKIKFDLPVIAFDELDQTFPSNTHELFAALVYSKLNRTRKDVCNRAKEKGYKLASYISSRAFIWHNAKIGEHCFVFEDNTIQPFVSIGDNVVLWSGNHIGHHSIIGSDCFISSHVVVSGWVQVGAFCFLGVNTTLANNTKIGEGSWISHGACLSGEVPVSSLVKPIISEVLPLSEAVLFRSLAKASKARIG